ncbi:MAG: efflux RND transporter periplasmic adaptor subunit [Candidatus Eisenbacteria bacterium]|nr:efflux RND transporter periplasmic adaptor subunit [Candidatus Eisenbacteria bacterium]
MNRTRWLVVAILAVTVAFFLMWKARGSGEAPKYRTDQATRGSIESTVSATGTVRPVVQVEVGSQVSGTASRLYADYNSRVRAGQVLCELEPSSFRARVVQNEAAVARAEAALQDAQRALRRARELAAQNYISQADIETAEVTVLQRQADLKAARAQLEAAQVDLEHTVIRAPIDGVVISRSIDLGQTVAASLQAPKMFVIANDLTQMQVETRIDEADIGVGRPGLAVTFTVDAFPDRTFQGQVEMVRLEPIVEQGVVTYTTVIRTQNRDLRLRPGMTANVVVLIAKHDDVLKIPAAALRFRPAETGRGKGGRPSGMQAAGGAAGAVAMAGAPGARRGGAAGAAPDTAHSGAQSAPAAARGESGAMEQGGRGGAAGEMRGDRPGGDAGAMRSGGPGGPAPAGGAGVGERWRAMRREGTRPGGGPWQRAGGGGAGARGGMRAEGRGGAAPGARAAAGTGSSAGATGPGGSPADQAASDLPPPRPGTVYVLRGGRPVGVAVTTGLTDGAYVEVVGGDLAPGDRVITGLELSTARGTAMTPPPGMGGPMMGRGGMGGGGRR